MSSLYDSIEDLLNEAEHRGVIHLKHPEDDFEKMDLSETLTKNMKPLDVEFENKSIIPIFVIDANGWIEFLEEVLNKSECREEQKFAKFMIDNFKNFMRRQNLINNEISKKKLQGFVKQNEKKPISQEEVVKLKEILGKVNTIDDFLKAIN